MIQIAALLLAATGAQTSADVIFKNGFEFVDTSCSASSLTRLVSSDVLYPNTGSSRRYRVDVTAYENIWGHSNNSDAAILWPGRNGTQPALLDFWKTQFVAAKFHVPADVNPRQIVTMGYGTYYSGPTLDLSVSTTCGDFNPANANCVTTNVGAGSSFKKIVVAPYVNGCPLTPGTDYYVNIRMTNPSPSSCSGEAFCKIATNIQTSLQP